MPKMKTNKAAAARFRVTGTGLLKRSKHGRRHKLSKKSSKQKRTLGKPALVDAGQLKIFKRMICV